MNMPRVMFSPREGSGGKSAKPRPARVRADPLHERAVSTSRGAGTIARAYRLKKSGDASYDKQKFTRAAELYKKAIGLYEKAFESNEKAFYDNRENYADALLKLGAILYKVNGEKAKGREYFGKAVQACPWIVDGATEVV